MSRAQAVHVLVSIAILEMAALVYLSLVLHRSTVTMRDEGRACAAICGSPYAEVIDPAASRNKMCLCPSLGGEGPRGQHWTLTYLDGGMP